MEAKDTVMSNEQIARVTDFSVKNVAYLDRVIAQVQAEISFKAGCREVVEWLVSHNRSKIMDFIGEPLYIFDDEWQAKLKEWGIEVNANSR